MFLSQAADRQRLPVVLLSGFLGSGKTTLVNALLRDPALAQTAVFINEFGEIPLDQVLVRHDRDATMVIGNGCLCCNLAGGMEDAVMRIFARAEQGELPTFKRIIMEPSGLADPAPIAQAILRNPVLSRAMRLSSIITTVDAHAAIAQEANFAEFTKQIALADRLVITKTDMVDHAGLAELRAWVRRFNPAAEIVAAEYGAVEANALLPADFFDQAAPEPAIRALPAETSHTHHHTPDITSLSLLADQPLDWRAFDAWLRDIRLSLGERLLRVKALVHVAGKTGPVVVQGVHHVLNPPVQWNAWPDSDHRTRLVLILRTGEAAYVAARWEESKNVLFCKKEPKNFCQF